LSETPPNTKYEARVYIGNAIKISDTYSARVYAVYDEKFVNFIKNFGQRYYNKDKKYWEINLFALPKLVAKFPYYKFRIVSRFIHEREAKNQIPQDLVYKTEPYDHEIVGVEYGINHDRFMLGDTMGLGKSWQALHIALIRRMRKQIKRCLIICGVNGNKYNWLTEVEKHTDEKAIVIDGTGIQRKTMVDAIDKQAFFWIINVESLRLGAERAGRSWQFPMMEALKEKFDGEMIVLDEFHACRNITSQQGRALQRLTAKYMVAMSGTFLITKPNDLYAPMAWVGACKESLFEFEKQYCIKGGYGGYEIVGYKNLDELESRLSRVMLRRTKEEVFDLPEKIYKTAWCEMTDKQQREYDDCKAGLKKNRHKAAFATNPLAMLTELRQITGDRNGGKFNAMMNYIDQIFDDENEKIIVYSNWTAITNEIAKPFIKLNIPFAYVTGEVNSKDRMLAQEAFQNGECRIIIGTIGALGTGFTLNTATQVIFADSPWSGLIKEQAIDRAHRIGTKYPVTVTTFAVKGSVDERVEESCAYKQHMSDMLVDGEINEVDAKKIVDEVLGM
jgi:SNF2 family DNA or RNA helicase